MRYGIGMKEADYIEDRNVVIEFRFAENQYDRLPALAADLVQRKVSVICYTQQWCRGSGSKGSDNQYSYHF